MKRKVSTASVREGSPLDFWHAWLADELHSVAVTECDSSGFFAECEVVEVGEIKIVRFRGTKQSFARTPSLIKSFNSDDYVFSLLETAPSVFEHNGYNARCRDGDAVLIDTARPYVVAHAADVRILNLIIPRHRLDAALGSPDEAAGLTLDGRHPTTQLIRGHVRNLALRAEELAPQTRRRMSLIAIDLIAAGLDDRLARSAQRPRSRHAALLIRVQAFIDDNLADPGLDLSRIASFSGISARRLQEIFMQEGTTVMTYVWERRLLRAARLLRHDAGRRPAVGMIAYRVGFSSPAHFARRFKDRFGVTPTECREGGLIDPT